MQVSITTDQCDFAVNHFVIELQSPFHTVSELLSNTDPTTSPRMSFTSYPLSSRAFWGEEGSYLSNPWKLLLSAPDAHTIQWCDILSWTLTIDGADNKPPP